MKIIEAIKKIYPEIQGGFAYWKTKHDGSEWDNPIDGLVWENTKFPKPTWEQILVYLPTTLEEKKQILKNQLISARKSYLSSKDWYVLREADEPGTYPQEVKDKRILARQEINDIEAATTLTALNQFSATFE